MKNYIKTLSLFFLILGNTNTSSCQSLDSDTDKVLKKILHDKIDISFKSKYYINCSRPKTYFKGNEFVNQTGLKLPTGIRQQLESVSIKQKDLKNWEKDTIKQLLISVSKNYEDIIDDNLNCLTKKDSVYKVKTNNPIILTFHNPIFDKKGEHCVITVVSSFHKYGFYSIDYFLKKIYGKWIVLAKFNEVIS